MIPYPQSPTRSPAVHGTWFPDSDDDHSRSRPESQWVTVILEPAGRFQLEDAAASAGRRSFRRAAAARPAARRPGGSLTRSSLPRGPPAPPGPAGAGLWQAFDSDHDCDPAQTRRITIIKRMLCPSHPACYLPVDSEASTPRAVASPPARLIWLPACSLPVDPEAARRQRMQ
jgi:hypothetical protein